MKPDERYHLVLAIYANTRGFAFVLFEGHLSPFDWGLCEIRGPQKQRRCLARVVKILDRYKPDVLVIREAFAQRAHGSRIVDLNAAIRQITNERCIPTYSYTRNVIRDVFEGAGVVNKQNLAELIAKHIPAFERYVPQPRKLWMSEDPRMGLFDAVALGL